MANSLRPRHPPSLNVQLDILDARQESEYINWANIECSPICVLLRQVESVLLEVESVLLIKWEL